MNNSTRACKIVKSIILSVAIVWVLAACDYLPGSKPKKVEFLEQSFAVVMPANWSIRSDLNSVADLQMGNLFKEAYTIVISENKADFEDLTMEQHSEITRSMIKQSIKNCVESDPEILDIDGNRAIRYQLTGSVDGLNLIYWHVTIETQEHYHQMLLWSLKSKFTKNQADFDSVIQSFEEV